MELYFRHQDVKQRTFEKQGSMLVGPASVTAAECFSCHGRSLWVSHGMNYESDRHMFSGPTMVWPPPSDLALPEPPSDLPGEVVEVYREAQAVAGSSARAAAALLRLALEGTLRNRYPGETNLNRMIGAAARDGLAQTVIDAMDVLRFNGNDAVHELRPDDGRPEVESLFQILQLVVTRLITEPAQVAAMRQALPAQVQEQIEQRDRAAKSGPTDG